MRRGDQVGWRAWQYGCTLKRLFDLIDRHQIDTASFVLLATPLVTVLSRNSAFLLLVACFCVFALSVVMMRTCEQIAKPKVANSLFQIVTIRGLLLFLAATALALTSLTWTPNPGRGLGALTQTASAAFLTAACCFMVASTSPLPGWLVRGLLISIFFGCCLILVELDFGSPVRTLFGGTGEAYRLNRAAVSVALMAPLLIFAVKKPLDIAVTFGLFALIWLTAFTSISESAKLAIVIVSITLLLSFAVKPRWLLALCSIALLASHAFAPLIGWAIYAFVPPEAFAGVGYASQHWRAIIWMAYASEVWNAPIFGHGMQASYSAGEAYLGSDPVVQSGLDFIHPHNFSIQVWYELGLVGVALSTALFILFIRRMFALRDRLKVVASALMAGIWSVAYVSHGAWQHWWWALVGIVIILFVMLARLDDEQCRAESESNTKRS